jgi:uncharacterized protein
VKFVLTRDAEEFAAGTRELFESRFDYNLIAAILAGVRAGRYRNTTPLFAYGLADGETKFGALRTPPWDMLATEIERDAAAQFVRKWLAEDPGLAGVSGPASATRPIAQAWAERTGGTSRCRMRELAYVLERVSDPPRPAPGQLRPAEDDELPLMLEWMKAFARETKAVPEERTQVIVDTRAADRTLFVWDHGGPVSMLGTSPPVAQSVRIGPVYTPPEHRRRGYAGSAVAAASRRALAHGAQRCILYTDVTNPTSNKIYAQVGYRRFGEHEEWEFEHPRLQ